MKLFKEKEKTDLDRLVNALTETDLDKDFKKDILNYLIDVKKNKRKNDFFDDDFLCRVSLEMIEANKADGTEFDDQLKVLKSQVEILFPKGASTENYEELKERFISNYCGPNGFISLGFTDCDNLSSFYALFESDDEYYKVLRVLKDVYNKKTWWIKVRDVFEYSIKVAPYMTSTNELKAEIISFMNDVYLDEIADPIPVYIDKRVEFMKEKCGIYSNINESTLALISSEVEKLEGYVSKLKNLEKRIDSYSSQIDKLTTSSLNTIKEAANISANQLKSIPEDVQRNLEVEVDNINKRLDEYLLELEERLKHSSDEVFNNLLESASNKLKELKSTVKLITTTTDSDLSRIKKQTEESIEALTKMADSNPSIQIALDTVAKHENLQKGLEALANMEQIPHVSNEIETLRSSTVIVPSTERQVIAADPTIIIPDTPSAILPAFDYHKSVKERKKEIMDKMQKRQSSGELFHEKTEEIIDCMLEGDWPYLWGPSGCGKTYTVEQVASLLGTEIIENGRITDDYTVLGYYDPQGNFRATATYIALAYGKILFLDEMDTGVSETQTNYNPIYSKLLNKLEEPERDFYVTFASDRKTLVNPNFRLISAGNTKGSGENAQFNARLQIDESVQQRMSQIEFKYDNRVEEIIFDKYKEWYRFFVKFRKACDEYAKKYGLSVAPGITTTRDASAIVKYIDDNIKDVETILRQKFIQTKDDTYRNFLVHYFKSEYNLDNDTYKTKNEAPNKIYETTLAKKFITSCNKMKRD